MKNRIINQKTKTKKIIKTLKNENKRKTKTKEIIKKEKLKIKRY